MHKEQQGHKEPKVQLVQQMSFRVPKVLRVVRVLKVTKELKD